MSTEPTLPQGRQERQRSQQMSLERGQMPVHVPGYLPERFLGLGAYGEVWVAVEQNTGRRVAIKFYTHRGGLDWSLLSREVEKLAFLFADRYVVQLIGVGWESDPPYYIMEYLEHGSLAERLQHNPLPVAEAVEVFRDVAIGLVHAHGKGVLHCDLKPANVLLDQDNKPRLADFGQSRLSHEQEPALGTLFYMAPEQADLSAVPEARWDVYALGALLYCMLTGNPPYRTSEALEQLERTAQLEQRLALYRRLIRHAPPPQAHWLVPGVDRGLAEIVDRCLATNPQDRYPNVQAVLDALEDRDARRARRPMVLLGALGPALVLFVVALFAWSGFGTAVSRSNEALTEQALKSNALMADYVAALASKELVRRMHVVEQVAGSALFRHALAETVQTEELGTLSEQLSRPKQEQKELQSLRERFLSHPLRLKLEAAMDSAIPATMKPPDVESGGEDGEVASWFFCDARGVSTVRFPRRDAGGKTTVGKNYAWRSFFHGGERDREESWRPGPDEHLRRTMLSAVFRSQANGYWIVAVVTPVSDRATGTFLGVVALTVRVNRFVQLKGDERQFPVLVDLRPGDHTGMILQHPLFDRLSADGQWLPEHFQHYRLRPEEFPSHANPARQRDYHDPIAQAPEGTEYQRHWLAQMQTVRMPKGPVGWAVIVQEEYDSAIGATLRRLKAELIGYGATALVMIVLVMAGLWWATVRLVQDSRPARLAGPGSVLTERRDESVTPDATTQPHAAGEE